MNFWHWLATLWSPKQKHEWITIEAKTQEQCLRVLEGQADLPFGDLSLGETQRFVGDMLGYDKVTQWAIRSEISQKHGSGQSLYVAGHILLYSMSFTEFEPRSNVWQAKTEIRRNCTGYWRRGVCTGCGSLDENY